MKKKLIILASIAPLFALGQVTTFVGEGATVKVKPNTLYHNIGEFKVKNAPSNQGKVSNEGNVNVQGAFTGDEKGEGFVNEFISGTSYGQLIIKDGETVNGKMTGKYKFGPKESFSYFPLAFPYTGYSSSEAVTQSGISSTEAKWKPETAPVSQRYKSPLFYSNNAEQVNDNIQEGVTLLPYGGYSINQYSYNVPQDIKSFVGMPNNNATDVNVAFEEFSVSNDQKNKYSEYYGSYIFDPTLTEPSGWTDYRNQSVSNQTSDGNYGEGLYTLGNPYTSNIDLLNFCENKNNHINALMLNGTGVYDVDAVANVFEDYKITKFKNGKLTGDSLTIIRPYQIFSIKVDKGQNLNLQFNDSFKKFDIDDAHSTVLVPAARKENLGRVGNVDNEVYQVGFDLYNKDHKTPNRFYIVAASDIKPGRTDGFEAYNIWLKENIGFYSLQENTDGTVYEPYRNQKTYINAINSIDYVGKPIHLVFQGKNTKEYTLKARIDNSLLKSGHKFYFEDKKEGVVVEVTPNFEYKFVEDSFSDDRFMVYWDSMPRQMSTTEVAQVSNTQVYKQGSDFKVKFSDEFKKADVYVYNLQGQIIDSVKNFDTSIDYTINNLLDFNVYVVKVVGDNGEVTTNKIIK